VDMLTGPLPSVDRIEFGKLFAPTLVSAEFKAGKWSDLRYEPLHAFEMHPAAIVFHYGQAIFEGQKAFTRPGGEAALFRPELNARRFRDSAERMLLPVLPEETFLQAVTEATANNLSYVPPKPGSLYLRPTMIGHEPCIGVRGSNEALFFVLSVPAGAYFTNMRDGKGAIRVWVDKKVARAAPGGTGGIKTSANYAGTLKSIHDAKQKGCAQVLYLDAQGTGHLEEMGGMNIFVVIGGKLVTPPLGGTILPGITRLSAIEAAHTLGIPVEERPISIKEIVAAGKAGNLQEAFACGTAATIVGISEFVFEDEPSCVLPKPTGPIADQLLDYVQGVQYGTRPDTHGWMRQVTSAVTV